MPVREYTMSKCKRCESKELDKGMTLCDPCLREIGTAMQQLEKQGVDLLDPDDLANPY